MGVALVACATWTSLSRLSSEPVLDKHVDRHNVWLFGFKVGAEAIVTVALVYFGYQMLRASERLLVPPWWATKENLDVLRALLGIDTPVDGVGKAAGEVRSLVDRVRELTNRSPDEPKDDVPKQKP